MIALIQRVTSADVVIAGEQVAAIDQGVLALIGVEKEDTQENADRLLKKILGYRIFSDDAGKMNLNVQQVKGGILLVPQFTLAADTAKGMRAGFSRGASPELGSQLFSYLSQQAKQQYDKLGFGQFGADMKVSLCNDGPVTFWLQC